MRHLEKRLSVVAATIALIGGGLALTGIAAATTSTITAGSAKAATTNRMVPALMGYRGTRLYTMTGNPGAAGSFTCQAPESATNPVPCFAPSQIRKAYDIPSKLTGAGETIVIIDAFGDPTLLGDLALFDAEFGLPTPTVNVICPDTRGCPTFNPANGDEVGWAAEISLDVQWSHAIAPGATIDLVVAYSDQDADIQTAQQYVTANNLGDVLSQSFGEGEACMATSIQTEQHNDFVAADNENMTVFAVRRRLGRGARVATAGVRRYRAILQEREHARLRSARYRGRRHAPQRELQQRRVPLRDSLE